MATVRARTPSLVARLRAARLVARPGDVLADLGWQLSFYARALALVPQTLKRYSGETARLLTEVVFGSGALAIIGGTLGVMIGMTVCTGAVVGLQGYASLNQLGTSALTGFIAAYFDTREVAPLSAGLALSATVGCGFTAQLGAMRISEEIDALEVMGIRSITYLASTRIIAGVLVVALGVEADQGDVVDLVGAQLDRRHVPHVDGRAIGRADHNILNVSSRFDQPDSAHDRPLAVLFNHVAAHVRVTAAYGLDDL